MPSIPLNQTSLNGFNNIAGTTVNHIGGAVKTGGTNSKMDAVPIYRDRNFTGDSDLIGEAFLAASGDTATTVDGTTNFEPAAATHIRKGANVEIKEGTAINKPYGATNRILSGHEVEVSGLNLLRDGRYVDSDGNILAHPTGVWTDDHERIDGSGDYGAKTRFEYGTDFHVRYGASTSRKTLPPRTS